MWNQSHIWQCVRWEHQLWFLQLSSVNYGCFCSYFQAHHMRVVGEHCSSHHSIATDTDFLYKTATRRLLISVIVVFVVLRFWVFVSSLLSCWVFCCLSSGWLEVQTTDQDTLSLSFNWRPAKNIPKERKFQNLILTSPHCLLMCIYIE